MKHNSLWLLLFFTISTALTAQETELDIDSLFENAEDTESVGDSGSDGQANSDKDSPEEESDIPETGLDLIKKEKFTFGASFDVTLGYSPGWELTDDESGDDESVLAEEESLFTDSALMLLSEQARQTHLGGGRIKQGNKEAGP